jgi:ferredoxin
VSAPGTLADVEVDRERCQGTGYCEQLAAGVFEVGADATARVVGEVRSPEALDRVRQAEDICPTRAIRVRLRQAQTPRRRPGRSGRSA